MPAMQLERVQRCFARLLNHDVTVLRPKQGSARVSCRPVAIVLIDALARYAGARARFGRQRGTLDAALRPAFERLPIDRAGARILAQARDAIRGEVDPHGRLDGLGAAPLATLAARWEQLGLLAKDLPVLSAPQTGTVEARHVRAELVGVACVEPEEIALPPSPGDEVYFIGGGAILDETGIWDEWTCAMSDLDEGVRAGDAVRLSPAAATLLLDRLLPCPKAGSPPVAALLQVALVEHEHGDRARVLAAVDAGWRAAQTLAAMAAASTGAGAVIALAIALPGLLTQLAIALDGDDELGCAAWRFDDLLGANLIDLAPAVALTGSNLGNDYAYDLTVHLSTTSATVESLADQTALFIEGPTSLSSHAEHPKEATYEITNQESIDGTVWTVSPGAELLGAGTRWARVRFRHWGSHSVAASATSQVDGRALSRTLSVGFSFEGATEHAQIP